MPERFEARAYTPEISKLMKEAFDEAWTKIRDTEENQELGRYVLASAVIDQVDAGVRDREEIVARAIATLAVARNMTQRTPL